MNLRTSVMARLVVMGLLMLGLLIPLLMVHSVVSERASRRLTVAEEVGATWGGPQRLSGPVLVVPYTYVTTDSDGKQRERSGRASFLPEQLDVEGVLTPTVRRRSLFKTVVYKAQLKVTGRFPKPDFTSLTSVPVTPRWNEATVNLGIGDPRGISRRVNLTMNGRDAPFIPGALDTGLFGTGLHASTPLPELPAQSPSMPFAFELDLNGSRDFRLLPAGSDTSLRITSPWPHPSFSGAPLPEHTITASGFTASWRAPYFGRGFAPTWTDVGLDFEKLKAQAEASAFGVRLIEPVDIYQQAERAVKYAPLFIVLTFAIFFLCEVVRSRLLHPIQYLFVGFAMCIFYLLLVSLSEHIGFDAAYAAAGISTIGLISMYSGHALGGRKEGVLMGVAQSTLYGFLYMLLRLEDYALLAGSVGLFFVLALLMVVTRRVDWYELRLGGGGGGEAAGS